MLLQELSRVAHEASQHRLASEEARGAKAALQSQLDEANASVRQLQALVGQYNGGSTGVSNDFAQEEVGSDYCFVCNVPGVNAQNLMFAVAGAVPVQQLLCKDVEMPDCTPRCSVLHVVCTGI